MVKLNDTAVAPRGTPQCPETWKSRWTPGDRDGAPYGGGKPWSKRVSASRHGLTATNGTGVPSTPPSADFSANETPDSSLPAPACQNGGACQFVRGMLSFARPST